MVELDISIVYICRGNERDIEMERDKVMYSEKGSERKSGRGRYMEGR